MYDHSLMHQEQSENKLLNVLNCDTWDEDKPLLLMQVAEFGKKGVIALINSQLTNRRFQVKFDFKNVKRTLLKGEFGYLLMFHHKLVLPKPKHVYATTAALGQHVLVESIDEDDLTITYGINLLEGPYANSIDEIVYNVNNNLGPAAEKVMKGLGIPDYNVIFQINICY